MVNIELGKDYGCEMDELCKAVQTMKANGWSDEAINSYLERTAQKRAVLKMLTETMKEGEI